MIMHVGLQSGCLLLIPLVSSVQQFAVVNLPAETADSKPIVYTVT